MTNPHQEAVHSQIKQTGRWKRMSWYLLLPVLLMLDGKTIIWCQLIVSYAVLACPDYSFTLQLLRAPRCMHWGLNFRYKKGRKVARVALYCVHRHLAVFGLCKSGCDLEEVANSISAGWSQNFSSKTVWAGYASGYYYGSLIQADLYHRKNPMRKYGERLMEVKRREEVLKMDESPQSEN